MKKFYTFITFLLITAVSFAQTQMNVPVTFDDPTVNYGLVGFGGAEDATVVTDPTLATNKVGRVVKSNTAELWAGASITALAGTVQTSFANAIPFTATERRMNVRVWSPHTGIQIRLKVEDKTDPNKSCETEATFTGAANTWQTLEFNFNNQVAGTAAFNPAFTFNKASMFFNFGVTGAVAGARTYFFDDVKFGPITGTPPPTSSQMDVPVTFDDPAVNYGLVGFGGAEDATVVTDPTLATNKVGRVVKSNTAELWAGASITALAGTVQTSFANAIPFTATERRMNVRVWSPHTGIQIRLKVEDKTDPNKSCETEATFTGAANTWQTLEFNFNNQVAGTAAFNPAFTFNKASMFFNFGVTGAVAGARTYFFDDVKFGPITGTPPPTSSQMDVPVTFDDPAVNYGLVGFGGAEDATVVTDPTLATNKVGRVVKSNTAELWAGASITALAGTVQTSFANAIPFTATERRMNVRVWSPHTGIQIRLKVEDKTDPNKSCETEATFTGAANTWQTLEFNFNNQVAGTAAFNPAFTFNKASMFFNFGVTGAVAGARTYFFDDVKFGPITGTPPPPTSSQMDVPVTFDDPAVNYGLVGFGGAEDATVVTDPTLATNKVGRVVKSNTAELWAGASITALAGTVQTSFANAIPFTATERRMNVRVWSPHTGIQIRLKVEDKTDPNKSCETEATFTGAANTWQTLEFNFNNQVAGTAAFNPAFTFNKASMFFNFGVTGAVAGARTYFFDDVKFGPITGTPPPPTSSQMDVPVTFDDPAVNYGLVGFGGAEDATVVTDPTLATNKVGRVVKSNTAELWAGASITALAGTVQTSFANAIPFTATERRMNVRVWSPHTGIQIRLKVEDKTDPNKSCETEATFTGAANTWQTLEFNFNNQVAGTAAFNPAFTFNKATIFFNFGVTGAIAGARTYFFDDVKFGAATVTPPTLTQMNVPVTFDDPAVNYGLVGFGGAEDATVVTDPTLATNKVGRVVKSNTAELWAGASITALAGTVQTSFANAIPFTATERRMNVRVWSPHTGIQIRLKVEDKNDPTRSCETEATFTGAANTWQTLEFNFNNQAAGTAAFNPAFTFNKATIFFNFGVTGAIAGARTYFFDDVKFGAIPPPPAPPAPAVTPTVGHCQNSTASPLTAIALSGNSLRWYTVPTGGTGATTAPTPSTTLAGTTNYYVSQVNPTSGESPRAMITVTVNPAPAAPSVTSVVSICQNSIAQVLQATPTNGSTLSWFTSATGGTATSTAPTPPTNAVGTTTYYVSQSNAQGCQSSRASISVTINALPVAPVVTAAPYTRLFPGLSTTLTVSNAAGTGNVYEWYRNDLMLSGQTSNSLNVDVNGLGNYKMKITNTSGCSSISNNITIADSSNSRLFVYPNPSTGKFQVRYFSDVNNLQPRSLVVFDSKGTLVYQAKYVMFGAYTPIFIDLGNVAPGIYTIYLVDNDGKKLNTERVIIQR